MQRNNYPKIFKEGFPALGTEIEIQIVVLDEGEFQKAKSDFGEVKKLYGFFTQIFSRFDVGSELSSLNANLGVFQAASLEMREITQISLDFNLKTDGFFDPRIITVLEKIGYDRDFKNGINVGNQKIGELEIFQKDLKDDLKIKESEVLFGTRMDFSGIAKGFITDKVVEFLKKQGWDNFLVDSGGDMFACGNDDERKKWAVGVEGIDEKKLVLMISEKGVATSGVGRRRWELDKKQFHHIINPKHPGDFKFDLKSVSVIADNTTEADVFAKSLFLMGKEKGLEYAKENGIVAIFLSYRGVAQLSPGIKEFLN